MSIKVNIAFLGTCLLIACLNRDFIGMFSFIVIFLLITTCYCCFPSNSNYEQVSCITVAFLATLIMNGVPILPLLSKKLLLRMKYPTTVAFLANFITNEFSYYCCFRSNFYYKRNFLLLQGNLSSPLLIFYLN